MAKILRANGHREDIEYQGPKSTLTADQLYKVVNGFTNVVEVPHSHNVLVINEEAQNTDAPINVLASKIAQRQILGDVVLCVSFEIGE